MKKAIIASVLTCVSVASSAGVPETKAKGGAHEVILQAASELDGNPDDRHPDYPPVAEMSTEERASEAVNSLVQQWAQSSNDSLTVSLAIQQVTERVFGLTNSAPASVISGENEQAEENAKVLSDPSSASGKLIEALVRQQYANTQAYFAAKGIKEVILHRGKTDEGLSARVEQVFEGKDMTVETFETEIVLRPLSSFSADLGIANKFASRSRGDGVRITARVPVSQILSTPFTGIGCLPEYEFVVIGKPTTAVVGRPNTEPRRNI